MDVKPGVIWTQQQWDDRLTRDLASFAAKVSNAIGVANLTNSTLLRLHKVGDFAGAQQQFGRWNKAAKVLPSLTRRRAAEAALYAR